MFKKEVDAIIDCNLAEVDMQADFTAVYKQDRLRRAAPKMLHALQIAMHVLSKHRLASMDQNPFGFYDLIGHAIIEAAGESALTFTLPAQSNGPLIAIVQRQAEGLRKMLADPCNPVFGDVRADRRKAGEARARSELRLVEYERAIALAKGIKL